jgi:hypothetical protein
MLQYALELEVEPLAALQLEQALELIQNSFTAGDFGASSRAEAVRRLANQCWGFVTAARGQGGYLWGGNIGNAVLTPRLKSTESGKGGLRWQTPACRQRP